jgi:hypothetical protein
MDGQHCEPPFWLDPSILFRHFSLQYKPTCTHSLWNFVSRIMILSAVVGIIASLLGGLSFLFVAVLFGAITASVIVFTTTLPINNRKEQDVKQPHQELQKQQLQKKPDEYHTLPFSALVDPTRAKQNYNSTKQNFKDVSEHYVNGGSTSSSVQSSNAEDALGIVEVDASPYTGPALPDYTPPTSKNLFMNVLLDEMKYNPDRPGAAPVGNPTVKQTLDDFFRVHWFSDPTDVFGKNQNQRQYVTQPSTTVPNDQGSFANWLYKIPGKTCKEGGRESCLSGTDGGLMPWLAHGS